MLHHPRECDFHPDQHNGLFARGASSERAGQQGDAHVDVANGQCDYLWPDAGLLDAKWRIGSFTHHECHRGRDVCFYGPDDRTACGGLRVVRRGVTALRPPI